MNDYTYSSEVFFNELLRISTGFIWKNPVLATKNESADQVVYVEQYILARQNRLTFHIVDQFAEEVLQSLGLTEEEVTRCMDDRDEIPIPLRDICLQRQIEWIIANYDEPNNYYRMLHGLPDKEDTDFFYNVEYPDISDSTTPIHLLDSSQIYALEAKGLIDKLIKENPKKKYLKHLTDRKIDIYTARNSDPFSILWISDSTYNSLLSDFLETYKECRTMIVNIFYQKIMVSNNSDYIGFVGLMILFQTLLQMHRKFLDTDITRDFYDEDSLRLVYDSYDVPYYASIPIEYHKRIVKNINILISHKGSTRVFYDLFDIFDFDGMAIFEFYMMKVHRFRDGKPVFSKNEDGSYNLREMYDIMFSKVQLYNDPTSEMVLPKNHIKYEDLIRNDPYWINDKDLLDKIYSEEFNYMESKYLGIQTTFNLMKIIYESSYYLKMILDNKELLSTTAVYNNGTHSNINIFDLVVYLCALIVKKNGFEGNIPTDIHEIGSVMGFNFKLDLKILKENISANDYTKNDPELLRLLETMTVDSLSSVKKVYDNLTSLRYYLTKKMADTDNVEVYWAYYELYQTILHSEYIESTFQKSNGETATSFADMLKDCNSDLYNRLQTLDMGDIGNEISDNLYLLKSSCSSLTHIQYADNINIDTIIEYLFKLLDFFKSAKADLTGYEIVYSLISSCENINKIMDVIVRIFDDHTSDPQYSIIDELSDIIMIYREKQSLLDRYKLIDEMKYEWHSQILYDIIDYLEDLLNMISETVYDLSSTQEFIEELRAVEIFLPNGDPLNFKDELIPLYDEVKEILKFIVSDEHLLFDDLRKITERLGKDLSSEEKIQWMIRVTLAEYSRNKSMYTTDDSVNAIVSTFEYDENLCILDMIIAIYKEKMNLPDDWNSESLVELIKESMKVGKSEFVQKDNLFDASAYLLYEDIRDNYIEYLDKILEKIAYYYIEDHAAFRDILSVVDKFDKKSSGYSQYGYIDSIANTIKMRESTAVLTDDIILRKNETFED